VQRGGPALSVATSGWHLSIAAVFMVVGARFVLDAPVELDLVDARLYPW